ncbi:hypothetical protein [Verrucomicrobium sp. BvORR034]|uniref:hypothetical protein n=1 Tax=Verrucomicrobium sp. BvORR034 TaxID=1396418 RepID=UPI000679E1E5|nr:hypothetical protein [Verrucomicrobium sp. BvORR034]
MDKRGGERLIAKINGWTLTLDSADGSRAMITKQVGDGDFTAQIKFPHFWDYLLVAKTLPKTKDRAPSEFRIVEDDAPIKTIYLVPESARPLFELMMLNHRTALSSTDPVAMEEVLNKNPPLDRSLIPNGNFVFKVSPR